MKKRYGTGLAASILVAGLLVTAPTSAPAGAQSDAAAFILRNLAGGAIGNIGARAMGQIIAQFGQGDELQGQIASINAQLGQLNGAIGNLGTQLAQLNENLHQVACDTNSNNAAPIVSRTQHALGIVDALSRVPVADTAGRERLARQFNQDVTPLISEQLTLQNSLMGIGGGQGVLRACARALQAQTGPFLRTLELRPKVENLVQYYRNIQAALIMLRVNYWTAHKLPQSYIDGEVRQAEGWIGQLQGFVKPTLFSGLGAFIDTRTGLLWRNQIHQITSYGFRRARDAMPGTISTVSGWNFPTLQDLQELYRGSPNPAGPWFISRAGMVFQGQPGQPGFGPIANPTGCIWSRTVSPWRRGERNAQFFDALNVANGTVMRVEARNRNGGDSNGTVCFQWLVAPPLPNWQSQYSYE